MSNIMVTVNSTFRVMVIVEVNIRVWIKDKFRISVEVRINVRFKVQILVKV